MNELSEREQYLESLLNMTAAVLKIRDKRIEELEAVLKMNRPFTDHIADLKLDLHKAGKKQQFTDARLLIAMRALREIKAAGTIGREGEVFYESPECKLAAKAIEEVRNYTEDPDVSRV